MGCNYCRKEKVDDKELNTGDVKEKKSLNYDELVNDETNNQNEQLEEENFFNNEDEINDKNNNQNKEFEEDENSFIIYKQKF